MRVPSRALRVLAVHCTSPAAASNDDPSTVHTPTSLGGAFAELAAAHAAGSISLSFIQHASADDVATAMTTVKPNVVYIGTKCMPLTSGLPQMNLKSASDPSAAIAAVQQKVSTPQLGRVAPEAFASHFSKNTDVVYLDVAASDMQGALLRLQGVPNVVCWQQQLGAPPTRADGPRFRATDPAGDRFFWTPVTTHALPMDVPRYGDPGGNTRSNTCVSPVFESMMGSLDDWSARPSNVTRSETPERLWRITTDNGSEPWKHNALALSSVLPSSRSPTMSTTPSSVATAGCLLAASFPRASASGTKYAAKSNFPSRTTRVETNGVSPNTTATVVNTCGTFSTPPNSSIYASLRVSE